MASPTLWTWVWTSSGSWWWTGKRAAVLGVAKSRTLLSDWTELNLIYLFKTVDWSTLADVYLLIIKDKILSWRTYYDISLGLKKKWLIVIVCGEHFVSKNPFAIAVGSYENINKIIKCTNDALWEDHNVMLSGVGLEWLKQADSAYSVGVFARGGGRHLVGFWWSP